MINYVYAYLMSKKHISQIILNSQKKPAITVFMFVIAMLIISVPAKHPISINEYIYNIGLIGGSVLIINCIIAAMLRYAMGKEFLKHLAGLVHITSSAFIINSIILAALYIVGMPFGASDVLLAVAATMVSTYYFIVLLAVSSTATIQTKNKMKYVIEIAALIMWYAFTFYILALTA